MSCRGIDRRLSSSSEHTRPVSSPYGTVIAETLRPVGGVCQQRWINGCAARMGDSFGYAAWRAGVVMIASYSTGVNRPKAS